jgi:hypothetical protein
MIESPNYPWEESAVPGERPIDKPELPPQGYAITMVAETETRGEGQTKIGRYRHFEVFCDEPPRLGGHDRHPQPLTYIAMGVGF